MKRICFVCYGNICRSPMAEFIFKDMIFKYSKRYKMSCNSRATYFEEIGNDIFPQAREVLYENGISVERHKASRFTIDDYNENDIIIVMEEKNRKELLDIIGTDKGNKIHKLREYNGDNNDIEDPWYTGRFDLVFKEIKEGCLALFEYVESLGDIDEV